MKADMNIGKRTTSDVLYKGLPDTIHNSKFHWYLIHSGMDKLFEFTQSNPQYRPYGIYSFFLIGKDSIIRKFIGYIIVDPYYGAPMAYSMNYDDIISQFYNIQL